MATKKLKLSQNAKIFLAIAIILAAAMILSGAPQTAQFGKYFKVVQSSPVVPKSANIGLISTANFVSSTNTGSTFGFTSNYLGTPYKISFYDGQGTWLGDYTVTSKYFTYTFSTSTLSRDPTAITYAGPCEEFDMHYCDNYLSFAYKNGAATLTPKTSPYSVNSPQFSTYFAGLNTQATTY